MGIVEYLHHGKLMNVEENLKGKHREYCLCYKCSKLDISDREKNCKIANKLYQFCIDNNVTTPVFECMEFIEK